MNNQSEPHVVYGILNNTTWENWDGATILTLDFMHGHDDDEEATIPVRLHLYIPDIEVARQFEGITVQDHNDPLDPHNFLNLLNFNSRGGHE